MAMTVWSGVAPELLCIAATRMKACFGFILDVHHTIPDVALNMYAIK